MHFLRLCSAHVRLAVAVAILTSVSAIAATPQLINYQGLLKDAAGDAVSDGSYSVIFTVYNAPAGGSALWAETTSVSTADGLFTVLLGSLHTVPDSLFYDPSRFLGITVSPDPEMTPRQQLSSVGYSFVSSQWTSDGQTLFRLNGDIGIGTASPASKLDIAGKLRLYHVPPPGAGNAEAGYTINTGPLAAGVYTELSGSVLDLAINAPQIGATDANRIGGIARLDTRDFPAGTAEGSKSFYITGYPVGGGSERGRFAVNLQSGEVLMAYNGGNVGIGTTAPTQKLYVDGNICATGTIGACSDARFKRDINPIEGSLDKIEKLQGVTYRWNRDEYPQFAEGNQIGFVAQKVKEVLPEVVSEGSDGTLSVDYGRFSVVLLEAIKEQQKQIEELKTHVAALGADKQER